jgi:hypothetical protein
MCPVAQQELRLRLRWVLIFQVNSGNKLSHYSPLNHNMDLCCHVDNLTHITCSIVVTSVREAFVPLMVTRLLLWTVAEMPIVSPGTYPPRSRATRHITGPELTQLTPSLCSISHRNGCYQHDKHSISDYQQTGRTMIDDWILCLKVMEAHRREMSLRLEDYSLQYDMPCGLVDSNISEESAASICRLEQCEPRGLVATNILEEPSVSEMLVPMYQSMVWHAGRLYSAVHGFWPVEELAEWWMGLFGVVKWWGVGVYLLWTSVWQGHLYLQRRREGLDQIWCCCCISDSLLAYRLKIPSARNDALHYNLNFHCCKSMVFQCLLLFTLGNLFSLFLVCLHYQKQCGESETQIYYDSYGKLDFFLDTVIVFLLTLKDWKWWLV